MTHRKLQRLEIERQKLNRTEDLIRSGLSSLESKRRQLSVVALQREALNRKIVAAITQAADETAEAKHEFECEGAWLRRAEYDEENQHCLQEGI